MTDKISCVHCGDDCGKYPVVWEGKAFCCHGCKSVYQLLGDHKLYKYYDIEQTPGIREEQPNKGKYAFLDNEDIKNKILDFSDESIAKVSLYIPAIHCSSCIWLLENLSRLHSGVIGSMVHFHKKEVRVTFDPQKISLRQLVELLVSIHYIPQISLDGPNKQELKKINRTLLLKIGVAGFAFGNIMLFSMPYYIPGRELIDVQFLHFFSWLNLMLCIPVVFYSGWEYLISAFKTVRKRSVNIDLPISLGILAIFIYSALEVFLSTGHGYFDSLSGFIFFLLIGKWYQDKTFKALSFERDYKSYFPVSVTRKTEDSEEAIAISELKVNDTILIRNQELVPADALLLSEEALIDYSFVTGESRVIRKKKGEEILAGGRQFGSLIELSVVREVEQSKLTRLWNDDSFRKEERTPYESIIDQVSRWFIYGVISIALITAVVWLFIEPAKAVFAATSVLIIACPCALALSMPFTFGNAMRLMSRKAFYLKKAIIVEKLAETDTLVFDKTGTITVQGDHHIEYYGEELTDEEKACINSLTKNSVHPLSVAIHRHLKAYPVPEINNFREIPAEGIKGTVNGKEVKLGSAPFTSAGVPEEDTDASRVYVSFDGQVKGFFAITITYREHLDDVMAELSRHYDLHLISGDNDAERMTLKPYFKEESKMHFNLSPEDKLLYIRKLRKEGKKVLMIGDGLNDAGALKESETGISIADDIYQFSPACDAILDGKQFHTLPALLRFSRRSLTILKVSFGISLLYNIIGLTFAVQALLSPIIAAIIMPVSSISVVAFAVLSTSVLYKRQMK